MAGGFFNKSGEQLWAGNIFSDQSYGPPGIPQPEGYQYRPGDWNKRVPFTTMQEFNVFTSPETSQGVFDKLKLAPFPTYVVPTDATRDAFIESSTINILENSPTYEGKYVSSIFKGIEDFIGPSALNTTYSLWDIIAVLIFLEPNLIDTIVKGDINVHQLTSINVLQRVKCNDTSLNPYNVIQFDPYIGQTILEPNDSSNLNIILRVKIDEARQSMITRLNSKINTALKPLNY